MATYAQSVIDSTFKLINLQRIFIFIALITTQCIGPVAYAQLKQCVFRQLSVHDGLSDNSVRAFTEDSKGFMWIGTDDGLNKYNGYDFQIYKNDPKNPYSITNNKVVSIITDKKGRVWIGTRQGLNLYDEKLDRFFNFNSPEHPLYGKFTDRIDDMIEDSKGNIWVASGKWGVFRIDKNLHIKEYPLPDIGDDRYAASLATTDGHILWIGTRNGLLRLDTEHDEFKDLGRIYGTDYEIQDIIFAHTGEVIMATSAGVKFLNPSTGAKHELRFSPFNPNTISGDEVVMVREDELGNLYFVVDGGGIDMYDPKSRKILHNTSDNFSHLSSNNVTSVYLDREGNIWAGTYMQGLNFSVAGHKEKFTHYQSNPRSESGLSSGTITSIFRDNDGELWFGTDGCGINIKQKNSELFRHIMYDYNKPNGMSSNKPISFSQDAQGKIWISTYGGGLVRYDKKRNEFKTFWAEPTPTGKSISVNKIKRTLHTPNGDVWILTFNDGLNVYLQKEKRFKYYRQDKSDPYSLISNNLNYIYQDKRGTIWLGTNHGLSKYDATKDRFINYLAYPGYKGKLNNEVITDILEDSRGNLWIATDGGGINLFDREKELFTAFTTTHGLLDNSILSIIEDNEHKIWIATKRGISTLDPVKKRIENYSREDGVIFNTFYRNAIYKDPSGLIYIGTDDGFLLADPNIRSWNNHVPPLAITKFKVNNKTILPGRLNSPLTKQISETTSLVLPYESNSFGFEFAALDYSDPERNMYSYIMEGYDNEWTLAGNRRWVNYMNLPPGKYTFILKGSNDDKLWNNKGIKLHIHIIAPFWMTWWFILISIIVVVSILWYGYLWRLRKIQREKEILEEKILERTEEVISQKREIEDSIEVGRLIQQSLLAPLQSLQKYTPDSFIMYLPKDIVSGDFYWFRRKNNIIYIAVADCTGHGVAGAFLTMIGHERLNEIIENANGALSASAILDKLNLSVIKTMQQRGEQSMKDGMDISIVAIHQETGDMQYAGAVNPIYIVRNNTDQIDKLTTDPFSIGIPRKGIVRSFSNYNTSIQKGDKIYMFSDGYASQLGGPDGIQKFNYPKFRDMILAVKDLPMEEQQKHLHNQFINWKGNYQQTDDILILGIHWEK